MPPPPSVAVYLAVLVAAAWLVHRHLPMSTYSARNAVVAFALVAGLYFGLSLAFAWVDTHRAPQWLHRRKIQRDACLGSDEYRQAFARAAAKCVLVLLPFFLLAFAGMHARMARWPNLAGWMRRRGLLAFLAALAAAAVVADFSAWAIHKLLHKGPLWERVHSFHHRYVSTVAVASLDAHPVEMVLWDALPFALGPLMLGTPPPFFVAFALLSVANTVLCHSGYDIGYDMGHHDLHHERLHCNYSGFLSDWTLGTYLPRERGRVYPRFDRRVKTLAGSFNQPCEQQGGSSTVADGLHADHADQVPRWSSAAR
jgi:sterol desaturase/sphingolipid hydroxylase (fatty acid hydroxylase superfamily)